VFPGPNAIKILLLHFLMLGIEVFLNYSAISAIKDMCAWGGFYFYSHFQNKFFIAMDF
jgi:hypothetical protein